ANRAITRVLVMARSIILFLNGFEERVDGQRRPVGPRQMEQPGGRAVFQAQIAKNTFEQWLWGACMEDPRPIGRPERDEIPVTRAGASRLSGEVFSEGLGKDVFAGRTDQTKRVSIMRPEHIPER